MARMLLPQANRPSTALPGKSDLRDENVYSALVLANGGQGTAKLFTVPQGQTIPALKASTITSFSQAHHVTYAALTTNLEKAGELGSTIGDAGIRALGFTLEQAAYSSNFNSTPANAQRYFGATPFEVADVSSKCYVELKVSNKRQIIGPMWAFPQTGGPGGSLSMSSNVTAGAAVAFQAGIVNNGSLPVGRKLKIPVMVARNDVLVVEFTAQTTLAFSDVAAFASGSHEGQPFLVWCNLISTVKGDVR